jgi:hypothetical protein
VNAGSTVRRNASAYVSAKEAFVFDSISARWHAGRPGDYNLYVVRSQTRIYGGDTLLIYDKDADQWFHNGMKPPSDRWRVHLDMVGRRGEAKSREWLTQLLFAGGVVEMVSRRMDGKALYTNSVEQLLNEVRGIR